MILQFNKTKQTYAPKTLI